MAHHILLIGNDRIEGDTAEYYSEYVTFFERSILREKQFAAEVAWTLVQDLYIEVGDGSFIIFDTKTKKDIAAFDAIIIRGMGFRGQFDILKTISSYALNHNVPIINNYSAFRDSSKLAQAVQFFQNNIPVAKTVYVNRAVVDAQCELSIEFPCIMKAVFGAHGNDNYVVHSLDDVRRIISESSARFVLQRFVPNDGDYRIIVAGDMVKVIERKAAKGSHLNNTSQGGTARLISADELPDGMVQGAIAITKMLDMSIAGVDALVDSVTGKYYFLEVNSQPQLMTGAYIDEKEQLIGAYLASLL
jgi:glutathione synthase/RimK-type ligase-like ATP-grasp enzyme